MYEDKANKAFKAFAIENDPEHLESILFVLEGIVVGNSLLECDGALIRDKYHLVIDDEDKPYDDGNKLLVCLCERMRRFSPDLIALDQIMPIRGTDVYLKLREVYDGPIVFTTVAPHDEEMVRIQREHSEDTFILSKPFAASQLEKTVQNILGKSQTHAPKIAFD
jgi:DNA-binding response OmpR family regulator